MSADQYSELGKDIRRLLKGPADPEKEFVSGGATFAEVYGMAADLRSAFAGPENQKTPVCLAADNRAIIAAALLASLAGGPPLLLPYSFSGKTLEDARRASGFTTAIADIRRDFPEDVPKDFP